MLSMKNSKGTGKKNWFTCKWTFSHIMRENAGKNYSMDKWNKNDIQLDNGGTVL